ncbi:MAG: LysM peptidoglycan-binding domain-containing protein [Phycisphaerales bacterium]
MNREQKISLIVGFSLVLLVGVLISDHFSGARSATIERVAQTETPATDLGGPPLREPAIIAAAPVNTAQTPLAQTPTAPLPSNQIATGTPGTQTPVTPQTQPESSAVAANTPQRPVEITNGRDPRQIADGKWAPGGDDAIRRAIGANGGRIEGGVIHLPPAGQLADQKKADEIIPTNEMRAKPNALPPKSQVADMPMVIDPLKMPIATHTVKPGETLSKIASRYYGTGTMWKFLAKSNPGKVDSNGAVRSGVMLVIPAREMAATTPTKSGAPAPSPPSPAPGLAPVPASPKRAPAKAEPVRPARIELATYTVRKGDTLGVISQKMLGTSKRVQEIMDLNGLDDEDEIEAGKVLKVPAKRG